MPMGYYADLLASEPLKTLLVCIILVIVMGVNDDTKLVDAIYMGRAMFLTVFTGGIAAYMLVPSPITQYGLPSIHSALLAAALLMQSLTLQILEFVLVQELEQPVHN